MNKPELLAPAGNMEKLKMALLYGADAVYIGGKHFGLRASAQNFDIEQIKRAVELTHKKGRKIYLTVNIIPHNEDLEKLPQYIKQIKDTGIDAVIVSDIGVFSIVKELAPKFNIHISTQANNVNWKSVQTWHTLGAKRVVLARELSLREIKEIKEKTKNDVELEAFIHGAMCISYSGRCLLSNYMTGRDANRGECAQPCRWKYYLTEEKRPGIYMPVVEDDRGTFIYNSKDLCMIKYIPQLIQSGITSFKIEGRIKSAYYVSTVVKAYREAIDAYFNNPNEYVFNDIWQEELEKVSHREYTTGFYLDKPTSQAQNYKTSTYIRNYDVVGIVKKYDKETKLATIEQRNKVSIGDIIEIVQPGKDFITHTIKTMLDEENKSIINAPHPQMIYKIYIREAIKPNSILRKEAD